MREDEQGGEREGERERKRGGGTEKDGCEMITVIITSQVQQAKEPCKCNTARIIKYNGMHIIPVIIKYNGMHIITALIHDYTPEARPIRTIHPTFCLITFLFTFRRKKKTSFLFRYANSINTHACDR